VRVLKIDVYAPRTQKKIHTNRYSYVHTYKHTYKQTLSLSLSLALSLAPSLSLSLSLSLSRSRSLALSLVLSLFSRPPFSLLLHYTHRLSRTLSLPLSPFLPLQMVEAVREATTVYTSSWVVRVLVDDSVSPESRALLQAAGVT